MAASTAPLSTTARIGQVGKVNTPSTPKNSLSVQACASMGQVA